MLTHITEKCRSLILAWIAWLDNKKPYGWANFPSRLRSDVLYNTDIAVFIVMMDKAQCWTEEPNRWIIQQTSVVVLLMDLTLSQQTTCSCFPPSIEWSEATSCVWFLVTSSSGFPMKIPTKPSWNTATRFRSFQYSTSKNFKNSDLVPKLYSIHETWGKVQFCVICREIREKKLKTSSI